MSGSFWKIRRELRRVGSQFLEPYRQIRDALLRVDYRLRHAQHVLRVHIARQLASQQ